MNTTPLRSSAILVAVVLVAVLVHGARADLGVPVKVHLDRAVEPAVQGQAMSATLVIESGIPAQIDVLEIGGSGWSVLDSPPERSHRMESAGKWLLDVVLLPLQPRAPLVVRLAVDGKEHEWALDLAAGTRRSVAALRPATSAERTAATAESRRSSPALQAPPPKAPPTATAEWTDDEPSPGANRRVARNIRVHGRLYYNRQGTVVGADGATFKVVDDDLFGHEQLAIGTTDVDGYFDVTFLWDPCGLCENDPDIVVLFDAGNAIVNVEDALLEFDYKWQTGEWHDFTGTDLDVGWVTPLDEGEHPALHLLTGVTRLWRWFLTNEGYDTPWVGIQWPASGGTFYQQIFQEIHISAGSQWSEAALAHEYGHHWQTVFGNLPLLFDWDYCNGYCDPGSPPLGCGHCAWCEETPTIAWGEGFANWVADFFPPTLLTDYGLAPSTTRDFESVAGCGEDGGNYHPPAFTEGFVAAVLVDIMDSTNDNDPYYPVTSDELSMGTNEILYTIAQDQPPSAIGFINAFKNRYNGITSQLWATLRNNGFDLDATGPPAPTNLYSSTHALNVPNGDSTPEFIWDVPVDDFAGTDAFSVCWSCASPQLPDANPEIGVQNYFVAPPMVPGTYYFNIRARDRAGNWGPDFASYGPFVVDDPDPADLSYVLSGGWDFRVVPRDAPDATSGNVHLSPTLPGNQDDTWWNAYLTNTGEAPTATGFTVALQIDGAQAGQQPTPLIGPLELREMLNLGPVTVPGGRHTLTGILDSDDVVAEPFETNNVFGHQFSWTPQTLAVKGTNVAGPAPPDPEGGWDTISDGSPIFDNVLGYRLPAAPGWNAAVLEADDLEDDYDLRLYTAHSGTDGFTTPVLGSSREPGCIDAVLANGRKTPGSDWDLGVANANGGDGGQTMTWVDVIPTTIGATHQLDFGKNESLKLLDLSVPAGAEGGVSALLFGEPRDGWNMGWFHEILDNASLEQALGVASLDDRGHASVEISALTAGNYAIVVWRDPKDTVTGTALLLKIRTQLPDLVPAQPFGWYASLVPRESGNSNPGWVPAPVTLVGDSPSTWLNLAVRNATASSAGAFDVEVRADGSTVRVFPFGGLGGLTNGLGLNLSPIAIPAGRHTLTLHIDPADVVEETSEVNGVDGAQWVFDPVPLSSDVPVVRAAPPDPLAGWSDVPPGTPLWFNEDGIRMPDLGGYFQALAIMPGGVDSDVDLRLHEASTGAQVGFTSPLATSGWGAGQSDFVLVNLWATTRRDFDGGVLLDAGADPYTAHLAVSSPLGNPQIGDHGPFELAPGEIVRLHGVSLLAGNTYGFEVLPKGNPVDWGISVHPADTDFMDKTTVMSAGAAWMSPSGQGEFVAVDITQNGIYCVAVWKAGTADLGVDAGYELRVHDLNVVAAPEAVPGRFAVLPNVPNPFNPSTLVRFELPRQGAVDIRIYDAAGRLVRTLLEGVVFRPGRQELPWHGRDDHGRTLASGVYYCRIRSEDGEGTQRLVLLK